MGTAKKSDKRPRDRSSGKQEGTEQPKPTLWNRLWQAFAAIVVSAVVLAGCFVAWKWTESVGRVSFISGLSDRGVVLWYGTNAEKWSSDWPFHNVAHIQSLRLCEGKFTDDDVRRLRKAFPNASIYSVDPEKDSTEAGIGFLMGKPVKLPEDDK